MSEAEILSLHNELTGRILSDVSLSFGMIRLNWLCRTAGQNRVTN